MKFARERVVTSKRRFYTHLENKMCVILIPEHHLHATPSLTRANYNNKKGREESLTQSPLSRQTLIRNAHDR